MRVRVTIELDIDPDAWVAAATEAEWISPGEISSEDHASVMYLTAGYLDAEDNLPRWARDIVEVVSQASEIVEPS